MIKVIELERSGIRDGDGYWHGGDVIGHMTGDLVDLCRRWEAVAPQCSFEERHSRRSEGEEEQMSDMVSKYFDLAKQGAAFDDVRLARMRERMTDADLERVMASRRSS